MALTPVYGIGGWKPDEPDENIIGWEEIPVPELPPPDPVVAALAGIAQALAPITPSSSTSAVRSALLGIKDALAALPLEEQP